MSNELHELDDIDVPDIRNRIWTPTRFEGVEIETVHAGARVRAAAIALAVFVIAALFAWKAFAPTHATSPAADAGVFIAVDPHSQNAVMDALTRSPLVVRNGCVLMGSGSDLTLPIWPKGFTASVNGSGRIEIFDTNAQVVAIEGQPVDMGGGYVAEFQPADKVAPRDQQIASVESGLGYQLPSECLSGIYGIWQVGDATPIGG